MERGVAGARQLAWNGGQGNTEGVDTVGKFETAPGRRVVGWRLRDHQGDKNYVPVVLQPVCPPKYGARSRKWVTRFWLPVVGE